MFLIPLTLFLILFLANFVFTAQATLSYCIAAGLFESFKLLACLQVNLFLSFYDTIKPIGYREVYEVVESC